MTCCTPARASDCHASPVSDQAVVQPGLDWQKPTLASFGKTRSFVGTDDPYHLGDGESPVRKTQLRPFALETVLVTNARFAAFVAHTGYRTQAEEFGWSPVFRGLLAPDESGGVAHPRDGFWLRIDGARWSAPEGPGSSIATRPDHPVVHISWADAKAFALWCGGRLPSEAEWEHAARGGLANPRFPWGDAEPDDDTVFCNIWQGRFPEENTIADGHSGTSPVHAFPCNGAGLHDMAGNVWEWTADAFRVHSIASRARARNATAAAENERVMKGGSFLCHRSYCYRYRIAARNALAANSCGSNTGFRVAYDLG